mgnify:CR=1 FL=1
MLFLTDVDHVSFEKANETRQNNLQSATVSLQVVIGLCKRKETAALISQSHRYKVHNNIVAVRWLFFFCYRAATFSLFFYLNRQSSQKCHGHTPFRQNNKLKSHQSVRFQIFLRKAERKCLLPAFNRFMIIYCSNLCRYSEILSRSTTVPLLKKWRTISGMTAASSR